MTTRTRATDAEIAKRVEAVLAARLNGLQPFDLRNFATEQGWGDVSDRTLRRYVQRADQLIGESFEADRETLLRRHVAQRYSLFARAVSDGDTRTAATILKDLAELQNLYPAKRHELTGKDGAAVAIAHEVLSDDERHAAIERIVARFGIPAGSAGGHGADRNGQDPSDRPLLG